MNDEEKYFAYIKYEGEDIEDGFFDARKSANALLGFDELLRYFLVKENPSLSFVEFELPVRIRKGSWEALLPSNIDVFLIKSVIALGLSKYFGSALSEMAKNDFKNIGFKDLFQKAISAIIWVAKIGQHLKSMKKKKIEKLKFKDNFELIGIPNENGEYFYVPKRYYEYYMQCPDFIYSKVTTNITPKRELEIGLYGDKNEQVKIGYNQRSIFIKQEEGEEFILPELKHEQCVELEGYVTKGNEKSNSIGFQYMDHILICRPYDGSIVKYKTELFSQCLLKGYIDREDKLKNIKKKPEIIFTELKSIDYNPSTIKDIFKE